MLYSELRTRQDEEMKELMAERFKEIEHFRKLNNAAWGNPNMYAQDIERVEALYAAKIQNLREKQAAAREKYLHENKTVTPDSSQVQDENNPVDKSGISDYSKFKAVRERTEELKDELKKKRYYRRRK